MEATRLRVALKEGSRRKLQLWVSGYTGLATASLSCGDSLRFSMGMSE